ncbi:TldD/PmbA family protein [bacterium]|nr:MAG: TldD/PmbA family protein [bacterium]
MRDYAREALDVLEKEGASYGDIRIIDDIVEEISIKNGVPSVSTHNREGFGVRVIVDGAWGFSASPNINVDEIIRVARTACAVGKASARLKKEAVRLAPEHPNRDKWTSNYLINPFSIPIDKKLELLLSADKIIREDPRIAVSTGSLSFWKEHQLFMSTQGADIEQTIIRSGGGISATAVDKETGEIQTRSYPGVHNGQYIQMGWEAIESFDLVGNAERVRDEAIALLSAEQCPQGEMDIIIGGEQLALQIHESLGHPTELDRVLGMEANYAGTSFLTTEKLGNFKYGSDIVNIVGDGTAPNGLATIGYDDDGVRSKRWFLVKDGIFSGYLTNRELAHIIGQTESMGCNRADGWWSLPMIRMTNISLLPGDWELQDLISNIENGIFVNTNKRWSIDQKRLNFQFTTEIGWLIENGKLTKMVKNATYQGITPQFWGSCDAICNENHWTLWGVNNCGKGQPGQRAEMSHGASPARFRKIKVGLG